MITLRLHRAGLAGWHPIGIAMARSAVCSFASTIALGRPLSIAWSAPFVLSLANLARIGSVLGFGASFALLARIGAARASYIGVMVPLVALLVSTLFKHFDWEVPTLTSVGLAMAGNLLATAQAAHCAPVELQR